MQRAEWSVLCRKDGLVVAIVRGNGDDAAYSRLRAGYDSGDEELLKLFDGLAAKHLKVYAGMMIAQHNLKSQDLLAEHPLMGRVILLAG